jgi:hypothetical protein
MNAPETATQPAEAFTVIPGKTESGTPIFSVLVKRTYNIRPGGGIVRAAQVNPLVKVDVYYDNGDPEWATVQYETDLVPYKLATDVVLIGKAYAPSAKPVTELEVSLEVADHKKRIRVIGDRQCLYRENAPPLFTDPLEFTEMEVRYERAYGGTYLPHDAVHMFPYPRNPLGRGFALKNNPELVDGLALPNFEDPSDLLMPERVVLEDPYRWNQQPLPQGLGWFQRTWYPRCSFVGAVPGFVNLDEVMREEVLGLVPQQQVALARQFKLPSFDARFNNGASLGLALPYLAGGEPITLVNLIPEGRLKFSLPEDWPHIMLDIGLGENELVAVLQTVCLRPEAMQVDLVWRGAHEYPGVDWLPEMKRMIARVW